MGGDGLPDELPHLVPKDLAVKSLRVRAQLVRIPGSGFCSPNRPNETLHLLFLEQHAGPTIDDGVQRATTSVGNDRPTAGVGLQRRDAEILFARKDQRAAARVELLQLVVCDAPDELDIAPCSSAQRRQI